MPVHADGYLIPFTEEQIEAMELRSVDAADGADTVETREIGQSTLRRDWFCKWGSAYDACELIFGDEVVWNDSGTDRISRLLPDERYGRNPYRPEMVATKLEEMTGFGACQGVDENGYPIYPEARLRVLYEHVPYDLKDDEEVEAGVGEFSRYTWFVDSEGQADAITMPGGAMKYVRESGDGTDPPHNVAIPYNVNIIRPTETFTYNWERLPYAAFEPGSALYARVYGDSEGEKSFLGCINNDEIFNRPGGTVLFLKCKPKLTRSHTAVGRRWSLAYTFLFAPTGHTWLYFFDPTGANSGWYMVSNDGNHYFADTLPDDTSLVPGARDLNLLYSVD